MTETATYPKRLIEVDLPIKPISEHARREKGIRHGHISTLHMWWARRPLAACRAVICAALWIDPADSLCPDSFREAAQAQMQRWAADHLWLVSKESYDRFVSIQKQPDLVSDNEVLRRALLDFIADFANWDNSTKEEYLKVSRALTQAAHEATGGIPGTRPLVVDPFAGGGAIPLEALRVGADAFASDLNPVAVLMNKVTLEYIPRYGRLLVDEVRKWGSWLKTEAERELANFYPKDSKGATPIAYLWARTIQCEGPNCGVEIPLLNQLWIAKRRGIAAQLNKEDGAVKICVTKNNKNVENGTVQNGKVSCPVCGFTISADTYRKRAAATRLKERIYCTVLSRQNGLREYREPTSDEITAFQAASETLKHSLHTRNIQQNSQIPDEQLSEGEPRRLNVMLYGYRDWGSLFNDRQKLSITTFSKLLGRAFDSIKQQHASNDFSAAVCTILGLSLSNMLQYNCNMSTWLSDGMISIFIQSSSIPMRADYAEANPLMGRLAGGFEFQLNRTLEALSQLSDVFPDAGTVAHRSATTSLLLENTVDALVTDPPYYFAIPYAELSDFFYVWIKRFFSQIHPELVSSLTTPKKDEAIQNLPHSRGILQKDRTHFETKIRESLTIARQEVKPGGVAIIVFAHASTEGWESLLKSLLEAGWVVTGSWPLDTERGGRMLANRQRALASSVHLVCRPRENPDGTVQDTVGDWRDVLRELPVRVHEWMPRLTKDGVVGADAIFACLGPALEIFSRYAAVEKANGEKVTLKEYLEHVWATVAKEAFNSIFDGADATGFEEDARLTAIWFWAMKEAANGNGNHLAASDLDDADDADDDDSSEKPSAESKKTSQGYSMEYDAIRKLAQGLGVNLQELSQPNGIVTIKGNTAVLNSVINRATYLLGRQLSFFEGQMESRGRQRQERQAVAQLKAVRQRRGHIYDPQPAFKFAPANQLLFPELNQEDTRNLMERLLENGSTMLDRLHQSMLLFAHSHSTLLRSLLVETRFASDPQFWRLAQALLSLYPNGSDEQRWVEGVLSRKKSLGF